ncbi:MAG: hypothetical protein Q9181_008339, partial [Wetmoreana brouardii]
TLLEKADGKRRLEKIVIQKEKFRTFSNLVGDKYGGKKGYEELQEILEGEGFDDEGFDGEKEVLSDKDLETLTDRSPEAYVKAEKGEHTGDTFRTVEKKGNDTDLLASIS